MVVSIKSPPANNRLANVVRKNSEPRIVEFTNETGKVLEDTADTVGVGPVRIRQSAGWQFGRDRIQESKLLQEYQTTVAVQSWLCKKAF